jgi:sulfoxide reductase heme-binding subunit YedZ
VTLILLSVAVALGVVRAAHPAFQPLLVEGVHRNLTLLALAFAALHVVAAVADPYAQLSVLDAAVPLISAYRTTWLAFGIVSGYLFAIVLISSWPVRRLGRMAWRWLHRVAYVGWVVAVVHSLGTGSDVRNPVFLALTMAAVVGVLVTFLGVRLAEERNHRSLNAAVGVLAILTVVVIAVWAANGPMRPGWARSAGTPPGLLHTP